MTDHTAQTYKPFTCSIATEFTDIIYLVCTADSIKLCMQGSVVYVVMLC